MRKHISVGVAAAALFLLPATGWTFQQSSTQNQQQSAATAQPAAQAPQVAPAQQDSLAAAARRTREEKKEQPKPAKVFTNDDLPAVGGISSVGEASATGENGAGENKSDAKASAADAGSSSEEKVWRAKFATLRHNLEQDQQELDVMQRELGVLDVQYYSNPMKAMQQDLTRSDINKKTSDIEAKKQKIVADQQAISDAEDDLRKAGGDSGWAR